MTDSIGAILTKLESVVLNQGKQENHLLRIEETHNIRLVKIEEAITLLAVQDEKISANKAMHDEKISTIKQEQKAQWKILDANFKQGGTVEKIKLHQERCPIEKITEIERKLDILELCQAKCPAQNTKIHLFGMWSAIILISSLLATVFNSVLHQSEKLTEVIKGIAK